MVNTPLKFISFVRNKTRELFMEPFIRPPDVWPVRIVYPAESYGWTLPHGVSLRYQPADSDTPGTILLRIGDVELTINEHSHNLPGARIASRNWLMQMMKHLENGDSLQERQDRMISQMCDGASAFFDYLRQEWIRACEQASEQHIRYTASFLDFVQSLPLDKLFQDVLVLANLLSTNYVQSEAAGHYRIMLVRQEQLLNCRSEINDTYGYRSIEHLARDLLHYMVRLAALRFALKSGYDIRFNVVLVRINNVLVQTHDVISVYQRYIIVEPGMTMRSAVSELFPHPIKNSCFVRPLARGNLMHIASLMNQLPRLTPQVSLMMGDKVMLLEYDIDLNNCPI
ncbi:MAG: hypothetical protein KatS3mg023_3933 [Armatimonadota bacterium]|nr:MAG: hypothetical protein KatS3mg023_3933 [Armatimonadota bacterium]